MIGGLWTLGRWFIDWGMRSGTPAELHEQVITVYGGTGDWKQRLAYSPEHEDDAYLILLDRDGIVRWLHHGAFDESRPVSCTHGSCRSPKGRQCTRMTISHRECGAVTRN